MSRGVLYVKWGDRLNPALKRSMDSVKAIHPELAMHVHELPAMSTLLDKAGMLDWTPFDETLYLDVDTVVLGRLDFAFEQAQRHGVACSICECPWARRYAGLSGDLVEYNTGVLFFTRAAQKVFAGWSAGVSQVDSTMQVRSGEKVSSLPPNDQAAFAKAIDDLRFLPFVLPLNWNFRPRFTLSFWGPVKIWHGYEAVPPAVAEFSRRQSQADALIDYVQMVNPAAPKA